MYSLLFKVLLIMKIFALDARTSKISKLNARTFKKMNTAALNLLNVRASNIDISATLKPIDNQRVSEEE